MTPAPSKSQVSVGGGEQAVCQCRGAPSPFEGPTSAPPLQVTGEMSLFMLTLTCKQLTRHSPHPQLTQALVWLTWLRTMITFQFQSHWNSTLPPGSRVIQPIRSKLPQVQVKVLGKERILKKRKLAHLSKSLFWSPLPSCSAPPINSPSLSHPQAHLGCTCNVHSLHNIRLEYLCCVLPIFPFQKPASEC